MKYADPVAYRTALEQRLKNDSDGGLLLDRLRRVVLFERIVARLEAAAPGRWVLKGGMALEVRLRERARVTKDIDLGLRDDVDQAEDLGGLLQAALGSDPDGDLFVFEIGVPIALGIDGGGHITWRVKVSARLAGRPFGGIQLDISPRAHELRATDHIELPNSLAFAGIPSREVEVVDINRHAAEKFHGMVRTFDDRDNSRVRDLVDLVLLVEHDLLSPRVVAAEAKQVWAERNEGEPPAELPALPVSWPAQYERTASELDVDTRTFSAAVDLVGRLWTEMFPREEN